MSDSDSTSSGEEEKKLNALKKLVKKEKKEKKKSKSSKNSAPPSDSDDVADGSTDGDEEQEDESTAAALTPSSKKRKRDPIPDEIEIDINLPEPVSKKAARKAKKAKTLPAPAANGTAGTASDAATDAAAATITTTTDAAKRSDHSVWIGNLPWTATKELLLTFLTTNAEIKPEDITRIHMPAPKAPPRPNWTSDKPQNKGFAYVDFATELAMYSAIALTETRMDNRPLLIKNSKNFDGRPDKPKEGDPNSGTTTYATDGSKGAKRGGGGGEPKAPSRKIFVGNLAFETSKEDLEAHFAPCGIVEHIHMATFEDSGKSKGFAWVSFPDIEAATSAVQGFVVQTVTHEDGSKKKKKWKLNKLMGRDLRCEFAEDGTTRYQKRFGKEKRGEEKVFEDGDDADVHPSRKQRPFGSGGRGGGGGGRGGGRGGGDFKPRGKVDPRSIAPGKAHANAPRASAAIVESKGKKTTFN